SARFDLMVSVAMLLALWIAGRPWRDWTRAVALAACFFLGALCKESVVVLPAAIAAQAMLLGAAARPEGKVALADAFSAREWKAYGLMFLAGVAYLLLRAQAMDGYPPNRIDQSLEHRAALWATATTKYLQLTFLPFAGNALQHGFEWQGPGGLRAHLPTAGARPSLIAQSREHRAALWATATPKYLQLTCLPFAGSALQHGFGWQGPGGLRAHLPALGTAVVACLAIALLAWRRQPAGWVLLAWLAAYLPVLHLVPLPVGETVIHQRFMYFPTALLLALLPYVLLRLRPSAAAVRASWALGVALVVASLL